MAGRLWHHGSRRPDMPHFEPIRYVDHESGAVCEEKVYGAAGIRFLYGSRIGRALSHLIAAPILSRIYGWFQDRPGSRRKVAPFIEEYGIEMDDFLPEEGRPAEDPYSTFNAFFTRALRPGARPVAEPPAFPAPCEARYFAYNRLDDTVAVPVKGSLLSPRELLSNPEWDGVFDGGPGFVARLCPVDYHRFHFPDDGEVLASWRIPGRLHSVNPWALAGRPEIFLRNERQVTIMDTAHLGRLASIEVGASFVGAIRQTYSGTRFKRGQEKGLFRFGGSTVIVLGENGRWEIDAAILENTDRGIETLVKMGQRLGHES